jgi:pilus assembly protein CpaB
MKLARVAVLGIALGAGVIAAMLALNLTAPAPTDPTEPVQQIATDTVKVLVAGKDLPMGSTITADKVVWRDWPKASVSEKFIQEIPGEADPLAKVTGAIARATFYEGEPINDAKLIRSDRGFMSAIRPEGKRAVAIKIAAETSAGGFILPNDRVDVIMSRKAGRNPDAGEVEEYLTETILNNVRVLAIDQTIEDKGNGETVIGQTATLELTPQQAEIITVAGQISDRLTLALRSLADSTVTPSDAAGDAAHLVGGGNKRSGTVTVVKNGVAREVTGLR